MQFQLHYPGLINTLANITITLLTHSFEKLIKVNGDHLLGFDDKFIIQILDPILNLLTSSTNNTKVNLIHLLLSIINYSAKYQSFLTKLTTNIINQLHNLMLHDNVNNDCQILILPLISLIGNSISKLNQHPYLFSILNSLAPLSGSKSSTIRNNFNKTISPSLDIMFEELWIKLHTSSN